MRPTILIFVMYFMVCAAASAATGKVIKVLPQFLDLKGRHSLSPSLYDRDAYQAQLRDTKTNISGMRFAVQWNGGRRFAQAAGGNSRHQPRGNAS